MEQANKPPDLLSDNETSPKRDSTARPLETSYISFDSKALRGDASVKPNNNDYNALSRDIVQGCYIAVAAVFGALLRIAIAQVFGEECANPGTIGWLSAAAPLCVTRDGDTLQEGGIIFSDFPSNVLGSFLMGTFTSGAVLGLAVPMAVAWLGPHHAFQKMTILHKAFTTGFCGSLTTFSSWNSEMVVMIFGTGNNNLHTQVWSAFFGYIIGTETAVGSFACGKSVAWRLHRYMNPTLAAEADAAKRRSQEGVPTNKLLPDFERRFLPHLEMGPNYGMLLPVSHVEPLENWRRSTLAARRVGHALLPILTDIETSILTSNDQAIAPETESLARAEGWDLDSLQKWVAAKAMDMNQLPSLGSLSVVSFEPEKESKWFSLPVASAMVIVLYVALFLGLVFLNDTHDAPTVTYRTMVFAMLLAPTGAIMRWKLANWNGKCPWQGWEWFPLGTFVANIVGSLVSAATVACEYRLESIYEVETFWTVGTIRALRVGFAGCLTTVSTFAAEVSGFMQTGDHAYPYILVTLISACTLGSAVYGLFISLSP